MAHVEETPTGAFDNDGFPSAGCRANPSAAEGRRYNPVRLEPSEAVHDSEPRTNDLACASRPARRALVVDDNADNAESLAMLLRLHGDDVRTAHNGIEALEIGDCFRPQIVLLDIGMPQMNGYETCRALRERSWGRSAIVIAQTGWGQNEDRLRALQSGFDAHLVKPIEFVALSELLAALDAERDRQAGYAQ